MMSTWCSKHVQTRNKLIVKQKCCASSWLITKINICFISVSIVRVRTKATELVILYTCITQTSRSQWPRGLRCRSAAVRFLGLRGSCMSVCCDCCVLSGRGLRDGLITRPEESYQLWCVVVCDLETSWMRRPWPTGGCRAKNKQTSKQAKHITQIKSGLKVPSSEYSIVLPPCYS